MKDVAPELLEELQEVFQEKVRKNSYISRMLLKVQDGTVNFEDVQLYSKELGKLLGNTFVEVLKEDVLPDGKLYWNIAERTMIPMLNNNFDLVNMASEEVQKLIDLKDGLKLNPRLPTRNDERIKGVVDHACEDGIEFSEVQLRMMKPTQTITESFFDEFIRVNADFKYNIGMRPQVIRTLMGNHACSWCKKLAGVYDYETIKETGNNVWMRHQNCHCSVIYKNNAKGYLEGAHTKRRTQDNKNARKILSLDKK